MRAILIAVALLAGCTREVEPREATPDTPRRIHGRLLTLDTHLDTPLMFARPGWDFGAWHSFEEDSSQVDLPRMSEGGLDGGFFVIWTRQGELNPSAYRAALTHALARQRDIGRAIAANGKQIELATASSDAERLAGAGKAFAYQAIENSYPIGTDLSNLARFYKLGVRMAGPVHSKNNQFADSSTDTPRYGGLSPLGKQWVAEMNRLGMVIDGSHASDAALEQMIALSRTPVILSHSGPDALFEHGRNIPDALMRRLAASGGVMQINTLYLEPLYSTPKADALLNRKGGLEFQTQAEQAETLRQVRALAATEPPRGAATFEMFMASLLHSLKVMGPDHVGLGADWDGGGGAAGLMDVAALPKITERLLAAGYSETDLQKIWSGNALRLLDAAERAAVRAEPVPK